MLPLNPPTDVESFATESELPENDEVTGPCTVNVTCDPVCATQPPVCP